MNNNNKFIEISVKQQLVLCHIGQDLIEIDSKINQSFEQQGPDNTSKPKIKLNLKFLILSTSNNVIHFIKCVNFKSFFSNLTSRFFIINTTSVRQPL